MSDITPPLVTITDDVAGTANLLTEMIVYTLAFDEAVFDLTVEDFTISNGSIDSITGSDDTWLVNVKPARGVEGFINLTLASGAVRDAAGNVNATVSATSQAIDTYAPVAPKLVTDASFNFLVDPQITMQTNLGTVVMELNPEQAPITVANMLAYVDLGFYDETLFHRVIPDFMVQGGGFTSSGYLKTPVYEPIVLESANGLSNLRGTIAMARTSAADSATSQFFVNHADNTFLDYRSATVPGYAVFGEVLSGMAVIDAMTQVETTTIGSYEDVPVTAIIINAIDQTLAGNSITNSGILQVSDLEQGAEWFYSLNGGNSWSAGSGSTLTVPEGVYATNSILVGQFDAAGNPNLTVGKLTSVLTVDTTAPAVTSFLPADAALSVTVDSSIFVTFNEHVQRGTGNIYLKTANGTTIATYDADSSANLNVTGNTLVLNPGGDLAHNTPYLLEFTAGTIKDLAGNSYAGTSSYDFTTGSNQLFGSSGNDILNGLASDDILFPGLGNDAVDGGEGVDTVGLRLFPNQYQFSQAGDQYIAEFLDFTTQIDNVEFVRFGTFFQTTLPIDAMLSGEVQESLAKLTDVYLAFFGRAPDVIGLEYWQQQLLTGAQTFDEIIINFAYSGEAQTLFPQDGSNKAFVETVYQNCFDRTPDLPGWYYWTYNLNGGDPEAVDWSTFDWAALEESDIAETGSGDTSLTERGLFIAEVLLGAYASTSGDQDRGLLTNRHEVAMSYANKLALRPEEGFDDAINDLLAMVDDGSDTRDRAENVLEHVFDDPVTLTGVMGDPGLLANLWEIA